MTSSADSGQPDEPDELRAVRDWYARIAPGYDPAMERLERVLFRGDREWVAGQAAGDVLELAVGTGRNLPLYPAAVRLTGIDLSAPMLARAADRAGALRRPVTLRPGDVQELTDADASYDTVVLTFALCCVPDPARALVQAHRVLRPGGRLLLAEHVLSNRRPVGALQRLLDPLTLRRGNESLTRVLEPAVEAAGFEITTTERHTAGAVLRLRAERPAP